jgi:predicted nucleotidyltransferase
MGMFVTNIQIPHEQIATFCLRWNIIEFALFGSVLRDDFQPGSDIDVLVSFAPDTPWTLFDQVTMQDELQRLFGRRVDLVSKRGIERSRNPRRRNAILRSAEVIYART